VSYATTEPYSPTSYSTPAQVRASSSRRILKRKEEEGMGEKRTDNWGSEIKSDLRGGGGG